MIKKYIFLALTVSVVLAACNKKSKGGKVALKNSNDSFSYALGASFGAGMKQSNVKEINWDLFKKAFELTLQKGDSASQLNKDLMNQVIEDYISNAKYSSNKTDGETYIAKCKKDGGYTVTKSGLLYKEIQKGNGIKPQITDTLLVNYTGKFTDGKVFDSNEGTKPVKFTLNGGIIPGFLEALQMMEIGSKVQVVIPYDLAYGKTGGRSMEPYKTLIFDLEVVDIVK